MKTILLLFFLTCSCCDIFAQPVFKDVLKPNREKLYRNLIQKTINKNLAVNLSDSTEELWQDAFWAMEVIRYHSPWADNKVHIAFNEIKKRTNPFQRSLLELGYANYPGTFYTQVRSLFLETSDAKLLAICVSYLLRTAEGKAEKDFLLQKTNEKLGADPANPILLQLTYQIKNDNAKFVVPSIQTFLDKKYLPGQVLLISFQRRDRDFPGLVLVRDASGNFVKDESGKHFSVPQLARSLNGLPGYISNGNTPEGIFRMHGFDRSKSSFIGPTTNIQLTMPFEEKASKFYQKEIADDEWYASMYKELLPDNFKDYFPAWQSYYAGKAGRTEIIAHGTTVNPQYYKGTTYYPLTPTQGCLCSKEIWSEETGLLLESDQQKLSDAITKAGGPYGYTIVINIDDKKEPVTMKDIAPFLKLAMQK